VPVAEYETPAITDDETQYLLDLANTLPRQIAHAGRHRCDLRLCATALDDGDDNPSAITRDYTLKLDAKRIHRAPVHRVRRC
jgi:glycerol-3-phosphate dehydrogenase